MPKICLIPWTPLVFDPSARSPSHDPLLNLSCMSRLLTADDILPLVASLTPEERIRLIRLVASGQPSDASAYSAIPPETEEFRPDDLLCWEAEGWEQFS